MSEPERLIYASDNFFPGSHCERFLRSNRSMSEIATPQEEHLRLAMLVIY